MPDLAKNPGSIFHFVRRSGLIRHVHQLERSIQVAKKFAEIGGASHPGQIPRTKVKHPLSGVLPVTVIAKFDICVRQKAVEHHVIRHLLSKLFRFVERSGEFVFAQQQPDCSPLSIEVVRKNLE